MSVGGEYGASATYLGEMAGQPASAASGQLPASRSSSVSCSRSPCCSCSSAMLHRRPSSRVGWRIPFVIGALAAVVAVWLRRALDETAAFKRHAVCARRVAPSALPALLAHPRAVATVFGLTAGGALAFYTFTTYAQKFLVNTAGFSKDDATLVSAVSLSSVVCSAPLLRRASPTESATSPGADHLRRARHARHVCRC
ncbi:MAG: hypothetical protein U5K74_00850 [Gemmatimonadaceae bacterium]|nr:hypothetical protein [Gemmatimonadaceae bacterium]